MKRNARLSSLEISKEGKYKSLVKGDFILSRSRRLWVGEFQEAIFKEKSDEKSSGFFSHKKRSRDPQSYKAANIKVVCSVVSPQVLYQKPKRIKINKLRVES